MSFISDNDFVGRSPCLVSSTVPAKGDGVVQLLAKLLQAQTITPGISAANPDVSVGLVTNPTANFTRPADTTAYAVGDLVANNTTAGSVAPLSLAAARVSGGSVMLRRIKLHKSGTGITNASFRVHFFKATVTSAAGDNAAFSMANVALYLGAFDVTIDRAFTDGAAGFGVPTVGSEISAVLTGTNVFALIEAQAAYTPASAEVFTLTLENLQN